MTRWQEFTLIILCTLAFALFMFGVTVDLARADEGEPLGKHVAWAAHPSLGVVLKYEMGGYEAYYAHPVMFSGPVKECAGLMGKVSQCEQFILIDKMGMVVLMTNEAMPYAYGIQRVATHKRINNGNYTALVGVTYND